MNIEMRVCVSKNVAKVSAIQILNNCAKPKKQDINVVEVADNEFAGYLFNKYLAPVPINSCFIHKTHCFLNVDKIDEFIKEIKNSTFKEVYPGMYIDIEKDYKGRVWSKEFCI